MINYVLLVRKNGKCSYISVIGDNETPIEVLTKDINCEYQVIDKTLIDTYIIDPLIF